MKQPWVSRIRTWTLIGALIGIIVLAGMQILGQAIEATKSVDQQKVADYIRATEFTTIVGKVKFGKNGEWAKGRTLMVQYQKIQGTGLEQFRGPGNKIVLSPDDLKSGDIIYPYAAAQK